MPVYEARSTETTGKQLASESEPVWKQRMYQGRAKASFRLLNLRRKAGEIATASARFIMRHKIISSLVALFLACFVAYFAGYLVGYFVLAPLYLHGHIFLFYVVYLLFMIGQCVAWFFVCNEWLKWITGGQERIW